MMNDTLLRQIEHDSVAAWAAAPGPLLSGQPPRALAAQADRATVILGFLAMPILRSSRDWDDADAGDLAQAYSAGLASASVLRSSIHLELADRHKWPATAHVIVAEDESSYRPLRVCIIEDEESLCRYVDRLLRRTGGFETAHHFDGAEALSRLESAPVPEIILLDVSIVGIATRAFTADWLAKHRNSVVVLMSGFSLNDYREFADAEPRCLLLPKPFAPADFMDVIRQAKTLLA
ncbi:MAG: response regulator [Sumerlaeia bacterium]